MYRSTVMRNDAGSLGSENLRWMDVRATCVLPRRLAQRGDVHARPAQMRGISGCGTLLEHLTSFYGYPPGRELGDGTREY